jgi:tetratricopeptide (TPR) repeat protein
MIERSEYKEDVTKGRNNVIPSSLRIAEREINENNFTKAIEILETLVNNSPSNAAAYFLLGRAHAGEGSYRLALMNFRKGSDLIGSEKTYQHYLHEIENLKRKQTEVEFSGKKSSSEFITLFGSTPAAKKAAVTESDIDENLISETLAKIYLSQGENNEAVRVYEKLIRKYPLKKLYFEAKISEIRSGIK